MYIFCFHCKERGPTASAELRQIGTLQLAALAVAARKLCGENCPSVDKPFCDIYFKSCRTNNTTRREDPTAAAELRQIGSLQLAAAVALAARKLLQL